MSDKVNQGNGQAGPALPVRITPEALLREMQQFNEKIVRGSRRLAELSEAQLAIATAHLGLSHLHLGLTRRPSSEVTPRGETRVEGPAT